MMFVLLLPQDVIKIIFSLMETEDMRAFDDAITYESSKIYLQYTWQAFQYCSPTNISLQDLLWMYRSGIQIVRVTLNFAGLTEAVIRYFPQTSISTLKEFCMLACQSERLANVMLSKITKNCSLLSMVHIFECPITDEGIRVLTSHCKHLTTIQLRRTCITDAAIRYICENCPLLRTIELINNDGLTNQSLYAIARTYPNLESITADEHSFNHHGYEALAHSCRNLISANLGDDVGEHVSSIWQNNHKLTSLTLTIRHMNESSIIQLAECCPNLQFLRMSACNDGITDTAISAIAENCPHLQSLHLHACISDDDREERRHHYARWHTTAMGNYFCFCGLRKLSATAYTTLACAYSHIQTLHVHRCSIDDEAIHALSSRCHELRQVVIGYCNITPDALLLLSASNPNIRALEIGRSVDISDAAVELLVQCCAKLNQVIIHASGKMTGMSITSFVERCEYLELLKIDTSCDSTMSIIDVLTNKSDIYNINAPALNASGMIMSRQGCMLRWLLVQQYCLLNEQDSDDDSEDEDDESEEEDYESEHDDEAMHQF